VRVAGDDVPAVVAKAARALAELRVDGVATNVPFLQNLLRHPALATYGVTTRFVDEHLGELVVDRDGAGARVNRRDPLAVLAHGKTAAPAGVPRAQAPIAGDGSRRRRADAGDDRRRGRGGGRRVPAGAQLLVMEAMKMEHVVAAPVAGIVRAVSVAPGTRCTRGTFSS
jgi:pyruvate carboxylase